MKRRGFLALSVMGTASLAGCATPFGSEPTSPPRGDSNATSRTPATQTPTPTVPEAEVIDYAELSPEQQEAFDHARNETVIFSSSLPENAQEDADFGIEASLPFRAHESVRKNGSLYDLQLDGPTRIGGTRVEVQPAEPAENDTAIGLANRTGDGYRLIERAIEGDGVAEGIRVPQPDAVSTGDTVEYQGTSYEITHLSLRDYAYFEMDVEERF